MQTCQHCDERIALRADGTWVHVPNRAKHCSQGPVPRPRAEPAPAAGAPARARG